MRNNAITSRVIKNYSIQGEDLAKDINLTTTGTITTEDLIAGNLTINGKTISGGNLLPDLNDTYNLGSDSYRWANLYLGGETLHLGNSLTDEGTITYDSSLTFTSSADIILQPTSGNVGIGVTSPTTLLDVAGAGKFTGNLDAKAGLDVTGDITVTGTVDGKDIATNAAMLNEAETITGNWDNTANPWDVSTESNLAVGNGITLTDDTLTVTASNGLTQTTGGLTTEGALEDLNTLGAPASDSQFIVATGAGAFAYESDLTARTSIGLSNVENTALSTWAGTTNLTTLGTIGTGSWNATEIGTTKGGTGLTGIAINKLLYTSGADTLAELTLGSTLSIAAATLNIADTSITGGKLANDIGITTTGDISANTLTSTIAIGDAPLTVTSTTKVTNLNADLLDGYNTSLIGGADTILVLDASGNLVMNGKITDLTDPTSAQDATTKNYVDDVVSNQESPGNCPTGFIWVPGNAKFGTLPGFCVMKYEAKDVGSTATSQPTETPWVSISQETAIDECQELGNGYHLISEAEWMTLAEDIVATPINDLDNDVANLQLATGHGDNDGSGALATTTNADPITTDCNLRESMEHNANIYDEGDCEIRGNGSYDGDDSDKGYYGTGQNWTAADYASGAANKSQMRTHVLSNGEVIWDLAGNVWNWTDAILNEQDMPTDGSEVNDAVGEWEQWNTTYNLISSLANSRPSDGTWTSTNGIGRIWTWGQDETGTTLYAFRRGGSWGSTSYCGVFSVNLDGLPTDFITGIGFRCAR